MMRINKYLSEAGICSRREADRLIAAGKVSVDGRPARMGMQVAEEQEIRVGKRIIKTGNRRILLAVNKPVGIVCTESFRERKNIIRFLAYPERITYAGRLDKDSQGLLLMSNDGDLIQAITKGAHCHEKEYQVTVDREITEEFLKGMAQGVPILDTVTRPCKLHKIGKYTFTIILTQGMNRQIRRMCEYFGYQVKKLVRTRILNIRLGALKTGEYREVTRQEWEILVELLAKRERREESEEGTKF